MLNSKKKKIKKSLSWGALPWGAPFLGASSLGGWDKVPANFFLSPAKTPSLPSHLGRGPAGSLCFPAAPAGPQEGTDDIIVNPVTKLMVPGPNCTMILPASGHIGPVPPGYFIHPDTGHVLPEAGHLGYDLLSSGLIPIADSNAGRTLAHFPALTLFWASEIGRCSLGTSRMNAHTAWLCP